MKLDGIAVQDIEQSFSKLLHPGVMGVRKVVHLQAQVKEIPKPKAAD